MLRRQEFTPRRYGVKLFQKGEQTHFLANASVRRNHLEIRLLGTVDVHFSVSLVVSRWHSFNVCHSSCAPHRSLFLFRLCKPVGCVSGVTSWLLMSFDGAASIIFKDRGLLFIHVEGKRDSLLVLDAWGEVKDVSRACLKWLHREEVCVRLI